jgi:hypothetical protein
MPSAAKSSGKAATACLCCCSSCCWKAKLLAEPAELEELEELPVAEALAEAQAEALAEALELPANSSSKWALMWALTWPLSRGWHTCREGSSSRGMPAASRFSRITGAL